ncbi:hypothetical protein PKNA1_C2_0515650 [Plasmodium knowlesi strain H]|uniref:Uncharacterized protein n=2 Tax=Plasmodium knowlesi TaxID=5850 RepID=A0A1A7VY55_PLAKH|nr:Uncharacterized protein PKNOH_S04368300 [Plasmodium knowlesi]SBO26724.1 hypothetical protein PKNA1_C2_0515650 [Plasmodium knowlesi strain H]SBO28247.1 hypothetical protein PKNA1_H1_0515650 [Plasmodium knowlesi strain H]
MQNYGLTAKIRSYEHAKSTILRTCEKYDPYERTRSTILRTCEKYDPTDMLTNDQTHTQENRTSEHTRIKRNVSDSTKMDREKKKGTDQQEQNKMD